MLRVFSLFVAVASALHVGDKKSVSVATSISTNNAAAQATKQNKPLRKSLNLANTLSALSHVKKQEPAAEEPPAGDLPIDEEGYEKDWGKEFRSEAYPASSAGKQHNPNYDQVAGKIRSELKSWSWWWWALAAVIVVAIGFAYHKKTSTA